MVPNLWPLGSHLPAQQNGTQFVISGFSLACSTEWSPDCDHQFLIGWFYNSCESEKNTLYLEEKNGFVISYKAKDRDNLFLATCTPLETTHIFPKAFPNRMDNTSVIPGSNIKWFSLYMRLHPKCQQLSCIDDTVISFSEGSKL
jgi:hypothetical protein